MADNSDLTGERIERLILRARGQRVMLDSDLARIYGVATARLNQQVKRNMDRFPEDFMFHLTQDEFKRLILQNATSKKGRGGRRKLPAVFTEHGAIMAGKWKYLCIADAPIGCRTTISDLRHSGESQNPGLSGPRLTDCRGDGKKFRDGGHPPAPIEFVDRAMKKLRD